MSATLKINENGEITEFNCDQLATIGRSKACDIRVTDPKASRSHAIVRLLGDGRYYIVDMGSANGTMLNDKRVVIPSALSNNDQIRLGKAILVFTQEESKAEISTEDTLDLDPVTRLTTGAEFKHITILVSDIRNYTSMSEKMPVDKLAKLLAAWFRQVGRIVDGNGGTVDKYIGDAVMVRWLTSEDKTDTSAIPSVIPALKTAHELNKATHDLNSRFTDLPYPIKIGVGINSGEAVLGNVGGDNRRDYTALGDSVNLAFRLESSSKSLQTDIVIGPDSYKQLDESVWSNRLQSIKVKGKEDAISVCTLSFDDLDSTIPLL